MEKLVSATIFVVASVLAVSACVVTSLTPLGQRLLRREPARHNSHHHQVLAVVSKNKSGENPDKSTSPTSKSFFSSSNDNTDNKDKNDDINNNNNMGNTLFSNVNGEKALGCLPRPPTINFCKSRKHRNEPGFWHKQIRRWTVFRIAVQVYLDYRWAKQQGLRLQQRIDKEKRQQQQQQLQLQAPTPVAAAASRKERATIRTPPTRSSTTTTTTTTRTTATSSTTTTAPKAEEDDPRVVEFWSIVHRRNAIRLTNQIKQLQGFWVKVGQFLSSRADVMPMEYIQELSSLQDSLPAKPLHDILSTLREEWGLIDNSSRARSSSSCSGNNSKTSSTRTSRSLSTSSLEDTPEDCSNDDDNPHRLQQLEALLESMDPIPLSTASLAQVHRARLPLKNRINDDDDDDEDDSSTGKTTNKNCPILKHPLKQQLYQDVVFKVQHVGIASLMRQDMENLKVIVGILAKMEPDFDFEPVFREYNQEVEKELDFRREARNMEEVRSLLLVNDDDDDDDEQLNLPQQNEETTTTTTTTATTSFSIVSSFLTASSSSGTSRSKQSSPKVKAIIPRVLHEYTTERVLVMEFCPGFAVRELEQMEQHNVNKHLLLERICTSWAIQMHVGGFFNAGT
jgi:predicted unusual protein kinase regulating ubiquinone biosynthesis (AarF/ABC1/UbiB family)